MTTQVIFRIDPVIKKKAQKMAAVYGSTFSAYLQQATYALVDGSARPGLLQEPERFNAKTRRVLDRALKDIKEGKNMIGPFKTVKEMDDYLDSK